MKIIEFGPIIVMMLFYVYSGLFSLFNIDKDFRRIGQILKNISHDQNEISRAIFREYITNDTTLFFIKPLFSAIKNPKRAKKYTRAAREEVDKIINDRKENPSQYSPHGLNEYKSKTISGMILHDRIKKGLLGQTLLVIAVFAHLSISYFTSTETSLLLIWISLIGVIAISSDQTLLHYRVSKGWYGRNAFESKEIVKFIIEHSEKNDFDGPDGLKKISIPEEVEKRQAAPDERGYQGAKS